MSGTLNYDTVISSTSGLVPPAKVTVADFKRYFLVNFPSVSGTTYDVQIQDAIDIVYDIFTGVQYLWDWQPQDVWYSKTKTCYRLLVAWYMADMYPQLLSGLPAMASGLPLREKRIDGVTIKFGENENIEGNALDSLSSNPFGIKARAMIRSAGKRALLRNRRFC